MRLGDDLPPELADHPRANNFIRLLEDLLEECEREGWDQPSRLVIVWRDGSKLRREEATTQGTAVDTLRTFAERGFLLQPEVIAVATVTEAWSYPQALKEALSELSRDEIHSMMSSLGPPSERADRLEVRSIILVERTGAVWAVVQPRGESASLSMNWVPTVSGVAIDACRQLFGQMRTSEVTSAATFLTGLLTSTRPSLLTHGHIAYLAGKDLYDPDVHAGEDVDRDS
jgi:hypothetical protein